MAHKFVSTSEHAADFMDEMAEVMKRYQEKLSGHEALALVAQITGMILDEVSEGNPDMRKALKEVVTVNINVGIKTNVITTMGNNIEGR